MINGLRRCRFLCGYEADLLSQLATHINSLARGSRRTKPRWSSKIADTVTSVCFFWNLSFLAVSFTHCLVSSTFHVLSRMLFIFPSRYYYAIGLGIYLNLAIRVRHLHTALPGRATRDPRSSGPSRLRLRGYHPLWHSFPEIFTFPCEALIRVHTPHFRSVIHYGFGLVCSVFARR